MNVMNGDLPFLRFLELMSYELQKLEPEIVCQFIQSFEQEC